MHGGGSSGILQTVSKKLGNNGAVEMCYDYIVQEMHRKSDQQMPAAFLLD